MSSRSHFALGRPVKSSYSQPENDCVELTLNVETREVSVENTTDRSQGRLTLSPAAFAGFREAVREQPSA
ncbi:DUF397 domain-containing protein [Amycolatopsis sp. lyj-112]|uniref:DUF397 domain-containing protein n=1 Tax=Amycolatopsis sp. lyj-112 TaxID=2789288 RepID=UPI00397C4EDF